MHIAKFSAGKIGLIRIGAALAVVAAAMIINSGTAKADIGQSGAVGALRLGVFAPIDSPARAAYGNYAWDGGLDYTFQQDGTSTRDIFSVDYIQIGKGSNNFQLIPITIGQQMMSSPHSDGVRPYVGYGIGLYILKLKQPGNNNFADSTNANGTSAGGYLNAGLDFNTSLFVDLRYHVTTSLKSVNPDGFSLTAGVRF